MRGNCPHPTRPVQVWVDCDVGIAQLVEYLQTIPGVRTYASCQGTIGGSGPEPYRAYVMAMWPTDVFERLQREFDIEVEGGNWGRIHPRSLVSGQEPA